MLVFLTYLHCQPHHITNILSFNFTGEYINQKWTEKKEIAMEKLDQKIGDKSAKEIYEEMKETGKDKMQGISSKYSKQVRLYSVFGLSFSALLITRRMTPSIFALGLSTYFICPEIVTDLFKQK